MMKVFGYWTGKREVIWKFNRIAKKFSW